MKDVARFFGVLADEARLKLLWLLLNHRELCVCDLMAALEITQSKASRHLATLRHAGLVADRKDGTWSYYSIRPVAGELERAQLAALRAKLAGQADAILILDKLHQVLARAGREAACTGDGACRTRRSKGRSSPRRPMQAGNRGSRTDRP